MYGLCRFLTHYFEADKGPFRNICDLSDEQIELIIEAEKGAETAFNRFALGSNFFKLRRAADDLLVEKYAEKFGVKPRIRRSSPFWELSIEPRACIEMAEAFGSESHFYPQNTLLSCIRIIFIWFGVKDSFSLKSHTPVSHFMICFSPTLNCRRRSGLITLTRASRKRNAVVCGCIRT